jgi:hypothetical protein
MGMQAPDCSLAATAPYGSEDEADEARPPAKHLRLSQGTSHMQAS